VVAAQCGTAVKSNVRATRRSTAWAGVQLVERARVHFPRSAPASTHRSRSLRHDIPWFR